MNSATASRLIELNREFYTRFGNAFSATRHRIQPGVRRALDTLKGDESILDLGCGNGELARELARRGHRGLYLGVDFSLPLLREAESQPGEFSATFKEVDLTKLSVNSYQLSVNSDQLPVTDHWSLITCFAVLHHIPSTELRLNILKTVRQLLKPDGLFLHSNWQFLNSEKLKRRIQPWDVVSVSGVALSRVEASAVDAGDYLLDWRSGGEGLPRSPRERKNGSERGLRYVHHFSESELHDLAGATGFHAAETFYSDGETGNLGLYQAWKPVA